MGQHAENGTSQGGAHLNDELHVRVSGIARRDEGGVQGTAERGQGIHGLLVVEPEDGINASGELGADWNKNEAEDSWSFKKSMVSKHLSIFPSAPVKKNVFQSGWQRSRVYSEIHAA